MCWKTLQWWTHLCKHVTSSSALLIRIKQFQTTKNQPASSSAKSLCWSQYIFGCVSLLIVVVFFLLPVFAVVLFTGAMWCVLGIIEHSCTWSIPTLYGRKIHSKWNRGVVLKLCFLPALCQLKFLHYRRSFQIDSRSLLGMHGNQYQFSDFGAV